MTKNNPENIPPAFRFYRDSSMQKKLPFLIFLLLLTMIVAFSWLSFIGIKKSAVDAGHLRLKSLSQQLGSMFSQSTLGLISVTGSEANKSAVKTYLYSGGKDSVEQTKMILEKLLTDSTWVLVELLNKKKAVVLRSANKLEKSKEIESLSGLKNQIIINTGRLGKIYVVGGQLFYPVIVAVTEGKQITGYLIRWRKMQTTQQAIDRFTQLLGYGVNLYVGNSDGTVWTDFKKQVTFLPAKLDSAIEFPAYERKGAGKFFITASPINNTEWTVLIELSQDEVKAPAIRFLRIALTSGTALIIIGIILTWLLSRSITQPLEKLTVVSTKMAAGNFNDQVIINRKDELGQLAQSFNKMAKEIELAQKNLESKVIQRTMQLEVANKELEAFSYSVSHDLRAPLRAINGYSIILKEDYRDLLDKEGKRILDQIIANAEMMGQLIDDLITFSKFNKKEGSKKEVDMKMMAETSFNEIVQQQEIKNARLQLMNIPPCYADQSMMKQVWINLIGNAVKYSSKNPQPIIQIDSLNEGSRIIYSIQDNGVGFDMKYAGKLFGVFQRLHRQDEFDGTGIGLALVKRIIEKQGGEIWAEAEVNKGAIFYFALTKKEMLNNLLKEKATEYL